MALIQATIIKHLASAVSAGIVLTCGAQAAGVTYFESSANVAPESIHSAPEVSRVATGSPASHAGLLSADRIVGVDGYRVRSKQEYRFLQFYHSNRDSMELSVLRDEQILSITMTNLPATRVSGCEWRAPNRTSFVTALERGGVSVPRLGFRGDSTERYRFESQSEHLITLLPGRVKERVLATARDDGAESREWISKFLSIHIAMRFCDFEEARRMLKPEFIAEAEDSFLGQLVEFYARIASAPPTRDRPGISHYAADVPFLAICYPYPVEREPEDAWFPGSPNYEVYLRGVLYGNTAACKSITNQAMNEEIPIVDRNSRTYYASVIRALMRRKNQGGWPYRSGLVYEDEYRQGVIDSLLNTFDTRPENRNLVAFCLLSPAIIDEDYELFEEAYRQIAKYGPTLRGEANGIAFGAARFWKRGLAHARLINEMDSGRANMEPYAWLRDVSPVFRYMLAYGFDGGYGRPVITDWIGSNAHAVALAITRPIESGVLDSQILRVHKGLPQVNNPTEPLHLFESEVMENPLSTCLESYLNLVNQVRPEAAYETIIAIVEHQRELEVDAEEFFRALCKYWDRQEFEFYASLSQQITSMSPDELRHAHERVSMQYTFPTAQLRLASELRRIGAYEEADVYAQRVASLYDSLTTTMRELRVPKALNKSLVGSRAFRDFATAPGFRERATRYGKKLRGEQGQPSFILFQAMLDLHDEDFGGMSRQLLRFYPTSKVQTEVSAVFDNRAFGSLNELCASMITRALRDHVFSEVQIRELLEIRSMDWESIAGTGDLKEENAALLGTALNPPERVGAGELWGVRIWPFSM